jgi:4-amino-4-deoxy-L-arabinose transferase-like glycosyltransferase
VRFLAAWVLYGLLFFSVAQNKLPGYVLPLMPPLAIVLAVALEKASAPQWWLAACGLLLVALPSIAAMLPDALLAGLRNAPLAFRSGLPFVVAAAVAWWLTWRQRPSLAVLTVAAAVFFGVVYVKRMAFPQLEQRVSVRAFCRANGPRLAGACLDHVRRDWEYGLNYYGGRALPECEGASGSRIIQIQNGLTLETK